MPATPEFFTLNSLPFAYEPGAPEPRAWLDFLQTLWPTDAESRDALQEIFGLMLTGETRFQKAFLLVGPKRSGKSTIARVLTQLLGQDNVCGPTLSQLGQQFGSAPLIGKRLAIIADARLSGRADAAAVAERILNITGEDSQTIDRKFREPWTGKLDTRLFIISNELPRLTDASGALASRLLTLVLTSSFYDREDTELTDKLLEELPGILNWAIIGWHRLAPRKRFVPPRASAEAQRELEDMASPITAFLRDRCKVGSCETVLISALYQAWCDWCVGQGRTHPGTLASFGANVRAALPSVTKAQPRQENGQRQRLYVGIGLLPQTCAIADFPGL
jgi:putative DNA primase/helicase